MAPRSLRLLDFIRPGPFANTQLATIIEIGDLPCLDRRVFSRVFTIAYEQCQIDMIDLACYFGISVSALGRWGTGESMPPQLSRSIAFYALGDYLQSNANKNGPTK